MNKDLEELVKDLQRKIDLDEERTYSKKVIQEYRNPVNFGVIEHPDATGIVKGPCNDTMRIDLKIKKETIQDARFWTDGCGASIACGNMLTSLIKGKTISKAENITSKKLIDVLNGLPKEHRHCAVLAVDTLYESIMQYKKTRTKKVI